eukprot:TRINITY_DN4917_c0_g1_i1.p1 TRINITY_DN4917_c0_g1~~TRINITY_DN4917_c0_g1_i1.p1  ORF type:complete len:466 (+),score=167.16 TRINITY_DN4917_c0_g1_i1:127-1524(+)
MVFVDEIFDFRDVMQRYKDIPAKTEDQFQELLKAVVFNNSHEDESKWAKCTDQFNERSADKKSKQWIKRMGAKIETPCYGVPDSPDEPQLSNKQRKKQKAVEAMREQAAARVAEDMPEDADEASLFIARKLVEHFWECIADGDLPEQEVEGTFGVDNDTQWGKAAYGAWGHLIQRKLISQEDIAQALANARLPVAFRQWVQDIPAKEHCPDTASLVKDPKSWSKLPWALSKLTRCARPDMQEAVMLGINESTRMDSVSKDVLDGISTNFTAAAQAATKAYPKAFPKAANAAAEKLGLGAKKPAIKSAEPKLDLPGGLTGVDARIATAGDDNPLAEVMNMVASAKNGAPPSQFELEMLQQKLNEKKQKAQQAAPETVAGSGEGYTWTQSEEEVEIVIPVAVGLTKKDVKVKFLNRELVMEAPRELRLQLHDAIEMVGCGWTLGKGQVVVTLEKKEANKTWPNLVKK